MNLLCSGRPWLLAVVATCLVAFTTHAQTETLTGMDAVYGEGEDVVLTDASQFHATLHSQGAGLGFRRGKFHGATTIKGWQGDLVFVRHPKEEKIQNINYPDALPYVLGKVNAHHALRLQRFAQTVMAEKYRLSGVALSRVTEYGVVAGVSKPVYLEIGYGELPYDYYQTERYDPAIHATNNIRGRAPCVPQMEQRMKPARRHKRRRQRFHRLDVHVHQHAGLNGPRLGSVVVELEGQGLPQRDSRIEREFLQSVDPWGASHGDRN